jgi:hypothetical protein
VATTVRSHVLFEVIPMLRDRAPNMSVSIILFHGTLCTEELET